MLRRLAAIAGLALLAVASYGQQGYAQRTQNIRAAVLTLDSTRYGAGLQSANDTPFVWLNVDNNNRIKPPGWNFYNPIAPGVADDSIVNRWGAISGIVGGAGPVLGSQVDKHKAAYWELRLSTATDTQLSQYDILLFSGYRYVSLNSAEREKLRKFVDGGGILWVDLYNDGGAGQANIDTPNNFPIPFKERTAAGPLSFADVFHPLMSTPNTLSLGSLETLATDGDRTAIGALTFASLDISGLDRLLMPLPEESQKMLPIAGNANGTVLSVGRSGDGFIVVTTRGYAAAINRVRLRNNTFDANNRYQSVSPAYDTIADNGAKLVINMVNLGSSFGQGQQGSRKQNSSFVDLGAPLLKRFDTFAQNGRSGAVIYKGLLVVTTDTKIKVYDANPSADLDGDGNPDDGIIDYSVGAGLDEIWESTDMAGPISAPICAEVPNSNEPTDQIIVVDGNGQINAFNAFPTNPNGTLSSSTNLTPSGSNGYTITPPNPAPTVSGTPSSVTFQDGLIVVGDTNTNGVGSPIGRVWIADARNGVRIASGTDFQVGSGVLPEFSASPVLGYIPIADNSGGVDRVIYLAGKPGASGAFPTASITSLWLGAKGETPPPSSVTATPTNLTIQTRAFRQGLPIYLPSTSPGVPSGSGLGVKLTIIDSNGDPWTTTQMGNYFDNVVTQGQAGELVFNLHNALPMMADGVTPNVGIRVDYTIDWGNVNAALSPQLVRGSINFPDDVSRPVSDRRQILGNIGLSPKGTLYAVVSTGDNSTASAGGGSFYELREEGRGSYRVMVRYDLYPQHSFSLSGSSPVTIPATFEDNDDVTKIADVNAQFLGGNFSRLTFTGGPTVRNGVVYVTAQGVKEDPSSPFKKFIPHSILMAFRGEPDNASIKIGSFPDGSTIVQPDVTQSSGGQKTVPNRYNTLQNAGANSQYTYDGETGTIYINNLANVTRGQIGSALSLSQPIIVKSPNGAPDRWFWPDANGSNWSPLLWYTVQHGWSNSSAPFVAGNTVYMAGTTALPHFLTVGLTFPIISYGVGFAMDASISSTDPFVVANVSAPWNSQVEQLKIVTGGSNPDVLPNPAMRWPQITGTQSFDTFRERLLQTIIGNSTTGLANSGVGVVGGDHSVMLVGKNSLSGRTIYSGFSKSDVVVADQGRIVRFDPSGNPLWSTDTSLSAGDLDGGTTGNVKGLTRPTRAYLFGDNDVLAVDPGTNRIVRLDSSGRETRSINGFRVDTNFVPDGYKSNEKASLDSPSDVASYGEFVPGPRIGVNPMSNAQPLEYWYHYVIADTGNHRVIDVVDRYVADPTTRRVISPVLGIDGVTPMLGVLAWHTPASYSSKSFEYTSVTRIVPSVITNAGYYYVAGLGNALPTQVDSGLDTPGLNKLRQSNEGNGGIVIFDPSNNAPPTTINEIVVPGTSQNVYYNDATGSFKSNPVPTHRKRLSALTSVTARNFGAQTAVMLTDASGVYEVVPSGADWVVRWMLPNESYRIMRGIYNIYDTGRPAPFNNPGVPDSRNPADLRATYARRLDSGEVLIVNGYAGTTRGNALANGAYLNRLPFGGEVVQVSGDVNDDVTNPVNPANPNKFPGFSFQKTNLGFGTLSIKFELPPVTGTRSLLQPIFADRR